MTDTRPLAGRTMIMSGGSRGIGLAIARRAAADGANITLIAKTDIPDPRLPGTIHTAAAELEQAGGTVLATDEASSQCFSMPQAAIARDDAVDFVVPLDDVAALLVTLVDARWARLIGRR